MKRMRKAAALALALTLLTAGCGLQTLPPTNVTSTSATLRAKVICSFNARGAVWWELRAAGGTWKPAGSKSLYSCGRDKKSLSLSKNVGGLRAGTTYQYRLVADPVPVGGLVVYSAASRVATRSGATGTFTPGVVASADHKLSAAAAHPPPGGGPPREQQAARARAPARRRKGGAGGVRHRPPPAADAPERR